MNNQKNRVQKQKSVAERQKVVDQGLKQKHAGMLFWNLRL